MNPKRDIIKVYREISSPSHLLVFDNFTNRYHAKDYIHTKPHKETHLPCETLTHDKFDMERIKKMSEYVGDLIVESKYNGENNLVINFILILIANPSFKLESYMEDIISELSGNNYAIQSIPTIKLSYMGIMEKDNHLFE